MGPNLERNCTHRHTIYEVLIYSVTNRQVLIMALQVQWINGFNVWQDGLPKDSFSYQDWCHFLVACSTLPITEVYKVMREPSLSYPCSTGTSLFAEWCPSQAGSSLCPATKMTWVPYLKGSPIKTAIKVSREFCAQLDNFPFLGNWQNPLRLPSPVYTSHALYTWPVFTSE